MINTFEKNIEKQGLNLPEVSSPVANYVGYIISGKNVFISGQIPIQKGEVLYKGKLGENISIEDGIKAAELCGLNIIAQLKSACKGDLSKVTRCVKLGGFVASTPDFTNHPTVINGASDLMVNVFGEIGRHSRAAVGVPCLPLDVAVEIDAIFEIA